MYNVINVKYICDSNKNNNLETNILFIDNTM